MFEYQENLETLDEVDNVSETFFFLKWRIFFFALGMWDRYGKAFNNIWAASAFKGNCKQTRCFY